MTTDIHEVPKHLPPLPEGAVYLGRGPLGAHEITPFRGWILNFDGIRWVESGALSGSLDEAEYAAPLDSPVTRHILAHRVPDGVPVLPEGAVYAGKGFNIPREFIGGPCWVYDFVVRGQWVEGTCHGAPDFHYAFPLDSSLARKLLGLEPDTRPSWEDAPEWAEWLAQDEDGEWFWFGATPNTGAGVWRPGNNERAARGEPNPNWRKTLEPRPAQEGHGTTRGDTDAKSEAIRRAIEVTAGPGNGSLTLSIDASKVREIVSDAIHEAKENGELADLCIPGDLAGEMDQNGLAETTNHARQRGYRIEWDEHGLRGWKG